MKNGLHNPGSWVAGALSHRDEGNYKDIWVVMLHSLSSLNIIICRVVINNIVGKSIRCIFESLVVKK